MRAVVQKLVPLQEVSFRLKAGALLPFNVRNMQGQLLLARGLRIADPQALATLIERGVYVDIDECSSEARNDSERPAVEEADFFGRWQALQTRLCTLLRHPRDADFLPRLQECSGVLAELSGQHADQLIFSVMRHDHSRYAIYGIAHAMHVAALCGLMAYRLGWPAERLRTAINAALTMNLSTIELQGFLAARGGPLTASQSKTIKSHPIDSALMLREMGVDDAEWLEAVEQHHEVSGGGGYPAGLESPSEMSQLLRLADVFTAKHSARAGRAALPAQQAAREFFKACGTHPLAGLMIKELGIYPPGCFVKLACGETAIVVERGLGANTPRVCALATGNGAALPWPMRRDTCEADFTITGTLPESAVMVKLPLERLYS